MNFLFRLHKTSVLAKTLAIVVTVLLAGCAAEQHHRDGMEALDRADYTRAVQELAQASELKPGDLGYRKDYLTTREQAIQRLLAQAATFAQKGDLDEAVHFYGTILQFDPQNPRALQGLQDVQKQRRASEQVTEARSALKHGDVTLANQWADKAADNAPNQADVKALKLDLEALQAKDIITAPSLGAVYKKPINLEFRDASVKMVFDALSRTTGINFIFDREVKGDQRTTVSLKQTTLDDAIDVILSTNQLEKKVLNPSSVLIYPNTPNKVKEYQDLLVKAYYLSNVEAKQAANLLKSVLKIKEVFVDDKYNMLVIRENPETITLADKLIALHDLEEPEVMLDVEVLEINRNALLNLGIDLTNSITISPLGTSSTTQTQPGSTGTTTPVLTLSSFKHLNSDLIGITAPSAKINVQKTDGNANLLANPRIRVRDREKAKVLIGDKVPVVTTTSTPTGFVAENIQYIDVGLKLDVEPDIHLRDEVGLKIALEVSSLVSSIKTNNGSQAYQIGTRNFSSALRLKDGETSILGGLIDDEMRSSANRIPIVGELPVLGRLFSSQSDSKQKTEIVLSITPHLIRNIQRKDVSAETFWSGTDSTLRTRPVQLRSFNAAGGAGNSTNAGIAANGSNTPAAANSTNAAANAATNSPNAPAIGNAPAIPADPNAPKLVWKGPSQAKVGDTITLEVSMESGLGLRAAPFQLAYNPSEFEIVSVQEGDFFNRDGKSNFSQVVDKASGRVSIGLSNGDAGGAKGSGRLITVVVKALSPNSEAQLSLIGMTPIGSTQAVPRPVMPVTHSLAVGQ